MNRNINDKLILSIIVLGTIGFVLEYLITSFTWIGLLLGIIEFAIITLFVLEFFLRVVQARFRLKFFRRNLLDLLLLIFITAVFFVEKFAIDFPGLTKIRILSVNLIVIRYFVYIFYFLKLYIKNKRLIEYYRSMTVRPAVTVTFSFLIVILAGSFFLMMPFATDDGTRLSFLEALFTATSSVCVTGLIVVDTATRFSLYGQLLIMVLIQIGGLGLMIMTYFAAFVVGKHISFEERMAVSYLVNEQDIARITAAIVKIMFLTFTIETIGAMLLFRYFKDLFGTNFKAIVFAIFHSVSAFCNAGFSLFSDSLMGFKSSVYLNLVICALIITGGLSFSVLSNLFENMISRIRNAILKNKSRRLDITMNTKAVLIMTCVLLVGGTLLIYGLEHGRELLPLDLKTQYLSAFFQSVTLRTAGFNTLDIAKFCDTTLLLMVMFMFIGGATGSTAGGVKVNTVFIIYAYIRSLIRGENDVVILKHSLTRDTISRAFLIIILSLVFIFTGTLLLTLTEPFSLSQLLFEEVSAFGTVGLSTGITAQLSGIGKIIIIFTMFIGRIGPLTLMFAIFKRGKRYSNVRYPEGAILF
jgi:trk system potassium uptake protein TrkH